MSLSALTAASGSGGKWRKVALFRDFREFFALAERPSTAAAAGSSGVTAELFLELGHAPFEVRVRRDALLSSDSIVDSSLGCGRYWAGALHTSSAAV
jgi:hypothetical protein